MDKKIFEYIEIFYNYKNSGDKMLKKILAIIWLIVLVLFIVISHDGNAIFNKLHELGIKNDLILNDYYMNFGIFSFFVLIYTTYITYKKEFNEIKIEKNIKELVYNIIVFILIGISFVLIQRNLLLSDMISEKKQQNYIESLEKRIKTLENADCQHFIGHRKQLN